MFLGKRVLEGVKASFGPTSADHANETTVTPEVRSVIIAKQPAVSGKTRSKTGNLNRQKNQKPKSSENN